MLYLFHRYYGTIPDTQKNERDTDGMVPTIFIYALPASLLDSVSCLCLTNMATLCDTVVFDVGWLSGGVILRGRR